MFPAVRDSQLPRGPRLLCKSVDCVELVPAAKRHRMWTYRLNEFRE